jgi:hypothetical protein
MRIVESEAPGVNLNIKLKDGILVQHSCQPCCFPRFQKRDMEHSNIFGGSDVVGGLPPIHDETVDEWATKVSWLFHDRATGPISIHFVGWLQSC